MQGKCAYVTMVTIVIGISLAGPLYGQPAPLDEKMVNIEWHLAPDPPVTLQDSEVCVINDTLINVCGFQNVGGFLRKTSIGRKKIISKYFNNKLIQIH